jgi:hypothetical protein
MKENEISRDRVERDVNVFTEDMEEGDRLEVIKAERKGSSKEKFEKIQGRRKERTKEELEEMMNLRIAKTPESFKEFDKLKGQIEKDFPLTMVPSEILDTSGSCPKPEDLEKLREKIMENEFRKELKDFKEIQNLSLPISVLSDFIRYLQNKQEAVTCLVVDSFYFHIIQNKRHYDGSNFLEGIEVIESLTPKAVAYFKIIEEDCKVAVLTLDKTFKYSEICRKINKFSSDFPNKKNKREEVGQGIKNKSLDMLITKLDREKG